MFRILLIAALLTLTVESYSQVRFGVRAGLHTIDVSSEELNVRDGNDLETLGLALKDANYGIHLGLMLLIEANHFYLQPELLFNSNNADYVVFSDTDSDLDGRIFNESYQYLDIPFMMGFKFGPLRLGGGPVGHVFINSDSEFTAIFKPDEYDQNFDAFDFGWQAGLGIDLWNIHLDFRYEGNFDKWGDHFRLFGNDYAFSDNPSRLIGTVGISF